MITLRHKGRYQLVETKHQTKVLYLGNKAFVWIKVRGIGDILIMSRTIHKTDYILSAGGYRLYEVEDEPKLVDLPRIELEVGDGIWQGYLLLTGLPTEQHQRVRFIPTSEVITGDPIYAVKNKEPDAILRSLAAEMV